MLVAKTQYFYLFVFCVFLPFRRVTSIKTIICFCIPESKHNTRGLMIIRYILSVNLSSCLVSVYVEENLQTKHISSSFRCECNMYRLQHCLECNVRVYRT